MYRIALPVGCPASVLYAAGLTAGSLYLHYAVPGTPRCGGPLDRRGAVSAGSHGLGGGYGSGSGLGQFVPSPSAMVPSAMTISTRRFLARPSVLVLSAMGRSGP